jgi:hypothetical protein
MYSRAANPIWYFVDLTGVGLNDNYWAFFLQNTFPYLPSPVYHDPNGLIPWSDPIQFYPNGTLPDNLYFNDALVYRIEIRRGPTQADALIYEIDNFVPCCSGGVVPPVPVNSGATDNQISNPQFAYVSFSNTATFTTAGTYEVAPDWFLVLGGTGNAVITQIQTITGSQDIINNPPFALGFNLRGWSSASLYQRFARNGALWGTTPTQNGSVSMSVTGEATGGVALPLILSYRPSVGATQTVASGTLNVGTYGVIDGAVILDASTNTDLSNVAYVDFLVTLPPVGTYNLTNFQVIGNGNAGTTPITPVYEQETVERSLDQLFHYYYNSIIFQPKDDILCGWSFSLNPFQFSPTAATTPSAICSYVADQTILYQKTASSVEIAKDTSHSTGALLIEAVLPTNQFALIQYIDPTTVMPYWTEYVSSLVRITLGSTVGTGLQFKMRLIYNPMLPTTIGPTEPILSWTGTDPVFSSDWTAIIPENDPVYTVAAGIGFKDYPFNKIQLPVVSTSTATLGIVFYTINNMSSAGTADFIDISRISLVANEFALDTNPITWDESLRRCQFYYEKSYDNGVLPGTASGGSALVVPQTVVSGTNLFATPYTIEYSTVKRAVPAITNYSPVSGTINAVDVVIAVGPTVLATATVNINNWSANAYGVGTKRTAFLPANSSALVTSTPTTNAYGYAALQYTIDSRLGV